MEGFRTARGTLAQKTRNSGHGRFCRIGVNVEKLLPDAYVIHSCNWDDGVVYTETEKHIPRKGYSSRNSIECSYRNIRAFFRERYTYV